MGCFADLIKFSYSLKTSLRIIVRTLNTTTSWDYSAEVDQQN